MGLDERLRGIVGEIDPDMPEVFSELHEVEGRAARRRRHRRVAAGVVLAVTAIVAVGALVQSGQSDHTEIGSIPATKPSSGGLLPQKLPEGVELIGVLPRGSEFSSPGSESPFSLTRTYAQFSVDGTRVERSFQLGVGTGGQNAGVYRSNFGDVIDINGLPAKVSGDESHSTVIWFDEGGRIFRVIGDIPRSEALRIAGELAIDPGEPLKPSATQIDVLPAGYVHLFDVSNQERTSVIGPQLFYATPNRDVTLHLQVVEHPSESLDERLLHRNARVVRVRGHRGVYVDGVLSGGRELSWLEPGVGLVTITGTTMSEGQLRAAAESLRPISNARWKQLRGSVGTLGSSPPPTGTPQSSVEPLAPIGPEVVAAEGTIDGKQWNLTVYEASPAAGRTERRFCYALRGDQPAPPSCFPLRTDTAGSMWLYGERHLNRWFLLGAAPHGAPSELAPHQGQPVPLQISEDPSLPMQVFVAVLPEPYDGTFSIRNQEGQTVNLGGPAREGARLPFGTPSLPGVYPEFPGPPFLSENIGPAPSGSTPTMPTTTAGGGKSQPAIQVLNATGTSGVATSRNAELASLGWATLPPDNFPGTHAGNAVQCKNGHKAAAKRLQRALAGLGTSASVEAIPEPRPPTYDPRAICYVILGD